MGVRTAGPFPHIRLRDVAGALRPLAELWAGGEALVLVGHQSCKTTRETLPYVDRIHRRRGAGTAVAAVLQDDAETARQLQSSLGLELPVRLEEDPYPLARELGLATVPTLFLVDRRGDIARVSEAFNRDELEALAERLGAATPLFAASDRAPAFKPG
jgi:hypothetical protein